MEVRGGQAPLPKRSVVDGAASDGPASLREAAGGGGSGGSFGWDVTRPAFAPPGVPSACKQVVSVETTRDIEWATCTCTLGFHVFGKFSAPVTQFTHKPRQLSEELSPRGEVSWSASNCSPWGRARACPAMARRGEPEGWV